MTHKVVAINQQCFAVSTASNTGTFNFTEVYKTNPNQRFLVKCIGLAMSVKEANEKTNPEPHVFLLKGLSGFRGNYNYILNGVQVKRAGVPLGVVGDGFKFNSANNYWTQSNSSMFQQTEFMLNEIPLDAFKIELININSSNSVNCDFFVQFQIETIE